MSLFYVFYVAKLYEYGPDFFVVLCLTIRTIDKCIDHSISYYLNIAKMCCYSICLI